MVQNVWGFQVQISDGVNLVAPVVGTAALINSCKTTSEISVMKNILEKVREVFHVSRGDWIHDSRGR